MIIVDFPEPVVPKIAIVFPLGTLNDTSEGHPAVVLADDEMEITDQFRIQVFEEWLTGARAALSQ